MNMRELSAVVLLLSVAVDMRAEEAVAIWHTGDTAVTNRVQMTDGRVVFAPEDAQSVEWLEVIPDRAREQ